MGLRFRQRISLFPGVHLNVSGKGVSISLGVPGATINLAPGRKALLTTGLPGTGISYQHTLDGDPSADLPPQPSQFTPAPAPSYFVPWERGAYAQRTIQSKDVSGLTSARLAEVKDMLIQARKERADMIGEVNELRRKRSSAHTKCSLLNFPLWRWAIKAWAAKSVEAAAEADADVAEGEQALAQHGVNLMWTLNDDAKRLYDEVATTFEAVSQAQIIWDIVHETNVDQTIARSSASRTIDRHKTSFNWGRPEIIPNFENDPYPKVPKLHNANGADIYIFPGFLLLEGPMDFAIVEPGTLNVTATTTGFVEEDRVPSDAQVIGETWKYVNKNGSPDRRFSNNYRIPIASYGSLALKTANGFDEEYQFSNPITGTAFGTALRAWANYLRASR